MRGAPSHTERPAVILSLVERGWQAARELSLDLQRDGFRSIHLIKGRLDRSVHSLIAPQPHVQLVSWHRRVFWPATALLTLGWFMTGRLRAILVDNDRSYRRLRGWARVGHVHLALVRQGPQGHELWIGPQQISRADWCAVIRAHATGSHLQ